MALFFSFMSHDIIDVLFFISNFCSLSQSLFFSHTTIFIFLSLGIILFRGTDGKSLHIKITVLKWSLFCQTPNRTPILYLTRHLTLFLKVRFAISTTGGNIMNLRGIKTCLFSTRNRDNSCTLYTPYRGEGGIDCLSPFFN